MEIIPIKTSIFQENEDLKKFINNHISFLQEKDIVVVTSKIIALSQGRVGKIKDKNKLIKQNSQKIIQTHWAPLTFVNDEWCINAGIDESNAKNKIILLPKNPLGVATQIQKNLKKRFAIKNLGVIITDTKSMPLRIGTIGKPITFIGFNPLKNYIGKKDLFGRKNRLTQSNAADALAGSAVLVMGEGNEQIPMVIIKNAPVEFTNRKISKKFNNLSHPPQTDIYAKVYKNAEI